MEFWGVLLPVVIDLVNRKIKDSDLRFWVSVGFCVAVGAGLNYLTTSWVFVSPLEAFNSLTASIALVFTTAQLSYKGVWENKSILGDFRAEMGLDAKKQ